MIERQDARPFVETLACDGTIEKLVVVGVAERLQAVDAGRAAHRRAVVDDLVGRLHNFSEALAKLIEQP